MAQYRTQRPSSLHERVPYLVGDLDDGDLDDVYVCPRMDKEEKKNRREQAFLLSRLPDGHLLQLRERREKAFLDIRAMCMETPTPSMAAGSCSTEESLAGGWEHQLKMSTELSSVRNSRRVQGPRTKDLPLEAYHSVFADFQNRKQLDLREYAHYRVAVVNLMNAASAMYSSETQKGEGRDPGVTENLVKSFKDILNAICTMYERANVLEVLDRGSPGKSIVDIEIGEGIQGRVLSAPETCIDHITSVFCEVKKEKGAGDTDPDKQGLFYHLRRVNCLDDNQIEYSTMPRFLCTISECRVVVRGSVILDKLYSQELGTIRLTGPQDTRPDNTEEVMSGLFALFTCAADIVYHERQMIQRLQATPLVDSATHQRYLLLPHIVLRDPEHRGVEGMTALDGTETPKADSDPISLLECISRGVYRGIHVSHGHVIVKVTRYNDTVTQAFLAHEQMAPMVFYDFPLCCGSELHVLVMEDLYEDGFCTLFEAVHYYRPLLTRRASVIPDIIDGLTRIVSVLESQDVVFGDLRTPNIMIRVDMGYRVEVRLIDFGLCQGVGDRWRPLRYNSKVHWPPLLKRIVLLSKRDWSDVTQEQKATRHVYPVMEHADDVYMLRRIIADLEAP
ncbi:hypothetical protein KIPB_003062 [Kipferlia bialata]|uniref:Protein kinase domain-containing protein n=1 Tax=Kipferlia bialata TaxID=797122 RepID=A0A391NV93_9EUKA|nr:hypothetical protein KIPB_003062 [Kipferlia bialata]|eukprot:g3062.t1